MRFCIFSAREPQDMAAMCIATIRHHHPKAWVVHLTDVGTPMLKDADEGWRMEWDGNKRTLMGLRARHLAALDDESTVILDTDILVRRPLNDAFAGEFDVAVTHRPNHEPMPLNSGVIFSKSAAFWRSYWQRMQEQPRYQAFLTEQECLNAEACSGKWRIHQLPCAEWNCSDMGYKKIPSARILHYKGERKAMMREHFERGVWQ